MCLMITGVAATAFSNTGEQAPGMITSFGITSARMMEPFRIRRRGYMYGTARMTRSSFMIARCMAISYIMIKWLRFVIRRKVKARALYFAQMFLLAEIPSSRVRIRSAMQNISATIGGAEKKVLIL